MTPIDDLRERGGTIFKDFITELPARNEIEFSAALAVLHNWGRINWKKVGLESGGQSPLDAPIIASEVINRDAAALCEYPLFSTPRSEGEKKWGGYRADVLFLAKDRSSIAYVENKIGARLSENIIARTIECLNGARNFAKRSFILLTGRELVEAKGYKARLRNALGELTAARTNVSVHIMYWEDVFNACVGA